jgi:glycosyltransferase involved in cell wall biosynthesis
MLGNFPGTRYTGPEPFDTFGTNQKPMPPLSATIITLNEERNIERCLASLQGIVDEIVVVDSLSTDRTKEICTRYGVVFVEQPFLGHIEQKNFAIERATHAQILSLDADEALSPELARSILSAKEQGFPAEGYSMNRLNWYCDAFIRHGNWYPDRKIRLIQKGKGWFGGLNPHDKIIMESGTRVAQLEGDLLHYTYHTIEEHVIQGNKFSTISARSLREKGRRAGWHNLFLNPTMAFLQHYVIKAGFLDGFNGLVIAHQQAYQTFLKYAKLMQLQRHARDEAAKP